MFFKINFASFPFVIIEFNEEEIKDNDFDFFLKSWENIYSYQKDFILIFDTVNMSIPSIKYCFKMSSFIKKIRNFPTQYLKKSIIIINNDIICKMLQFVFYLQPPVADVYLTKVNINNVIMNLKNNNDMVFVNNLENINIKNIEINSIIKSRKPLLPFL